MGSLEGARDASCGHRAKSPGCVPRLTTVVSPASSSLVHPLISSLSVLSCNPPSAVTSWYLDLPGYRNDRRDKAVPSLALREPHSWYCTSPVTGPPPLRTASLPEQGSSLDHARVRELQTVLGLDHARRCVPVIYDDFPTVHRAGCCLLLVFPHCESLPSVTAKYIYNGVFRSRLWLR